MKYERITYPDGQIGAKIIDCAPDFDVSAGTGYYIRERINSYTDLFFVGAIIDAIRNVFEERPVYVFIPCLFGQRSDRRFSKDQSFDLKLITNFINSWKATAVEIFDAHSEVAIALLDTPDKISSFEYVKKAVKTINSPELVLVSPDAGAYKKVFEYGEKLNKEVVAAVKHRDLKGDVELKFIGDVKDKDCLIVDDLCDGGYTFILLGKTLKEQGAKRVFLYVSHGYFSKGFKVFEGILDGIFCTNSVKDIENEYYNGWKTVPLEIPLTQYKII